LKKIFHCIIIITDIDLITEQSFINDEPMDTNLVTPVENKRYKLIQKLKLFIVIKNVCVENLKASWLILKKPI